MTKSHVIVERKKQCFCPAPKWDVLGEKSSYSPGAKRWGPFTQKAFDEFPKNRCCGLCPNSIFPLAWRAWGTISPGPKSNRKNWITASDSLWSRLLLHTYFSGYGIVLFPQSNIHFWTAERKTCNESFASPWATTWAPVHMPVAFGYSLLQCGGKTVSMDIPCFIPCQRLKIKPVILEQVRYNVCKRSERKSGMSVCILNSRTNSKQSRRNA